MTKIFKFFCKKKDPKKVTVSFYRDPDGRWYADLPEVDKPDCEMIEGCELYLENLRKHSRFWKHNPNTSRITLDIYTSEPKRYLSRFIYNGEDSEGYFYRHEWGKDISQFLKRGLVDITGREELRIWLCRCLELVYENIPSDIYVVSSRRNVTKLY